MDAHTPSGSVSGLGEQIRKDLLGRGDLLPSLPDVVRQVLRLVNDPSAVPEDFERVLRNDPAMVARILRIANSPLLGGNHKVTSIPAAVMVVGFQRLGNVAMMAGLAGFMDRDYACYGYGQTGLWQHSICVGTCAQALGKLFDLDAKAREELFVAGLVHDIGKIILAPYLVKARVTATDGPESTVELERRALGIDHQEAGRILAEVWNLPPIVVALLSHQNDELPADLPEDIAQAVTVVRLADAFVHECGIGYRSGVKSDTEPGSEFSGLGFGEWQKVRDELRAAMDAALESLRMLAD